MELLQLREHEIFQTLKSIKESRFVVIGGYAVSSYTLPRFSVDCDIIVGDEKELNNVSKKLLSIGYENKKSKEQNLPYHKKFERFKKEIAQGFKVSVDVLAKEVLDRQTNAKFSAEWVFKNSRKKNLKGRTVSEGLYLRIINPDALFVMKLVSYRPSDIRDCFMLATSINDKKWIRHEASERCDFDERFSKLKDAICSKQFKDNLQGIFGFIEQKIFDKHKKLVLRLEDKSD
ncbi:hypothetical protein FJZ53_03795 [Candidatus Woesearchaeota archaeon]|nr:hypothetical protein [Candidatus Woesearchaeota archaeon]